MTSLKSILSLLLVRKDPIARQRMKLSEVREQWVDTENLLPVGELDLSEILSSDRTDAAWHRCSPVLEQFGLIDGTGGVNPGDRRAIFYLVHQLRASRVLEIGTHIGASTIHLAGALAALEQDGVDEVRLLSVDKQDVNCETRRPWLQYDSNFSPREMIEALGFDRFMQFQQSSAVNFLSSCRERFDFIFLDGDHLAMAVYNEVAFAAKLLNPGGVILLHDYFPALQPLWSNGSVIAGPFLAAERLIGENAELVSLPLGDLPWPTKLGSNKTSLALLLRRT